MAKHPFNGVGGGGDDSDDKVYDATTLLAMLDSDGNVVGGEEGGRMTELPTEALHETGGATTAALNEYGGPVTHAGPVGGGESGQPRLTTMMLNEEGSNKNEGK